MKIYILVYIITLITVSLMAGLFYNWSFNITSGLAQLDDRSYLSAMQSLNRSILNPAFFLIFLGSIITLPILAFLQSKIAIDTSFYLIAFAGIIYIIGSIGTTFLGNIPLNNKLDILNLSQFGLEECQSFRDTFEARWNRLNLIRTTSSFISMVLLVIPLFQRFEKSIGA